MSNATSMEALFLRNNILVVSTIENDRLSRKVLGFFKTLCIFYEFSKWRLPKPLKLSSRLVGESIPSNLDWNQSQSVEHEDGFSMQ